jgi:hypothetical protein
MRRSTVPRDGTRSPRVLHSRVISRQAEATVRRCRVRYRVRRTSRTTASTSSGNRPLPRPPLEVPGSRSETRPSPDLHRLTSRYTWRRETPSSAAAASAAPVPTTGCPASSLITPARRTARSHAPAGAVSTPRSATAWSSAIPESPPPSCTRVRTGIDRSAEDSGTRWNPEAACTQKHWPTSSVQTSSDIHRDAGFRSRLHAPGGVSGSRSPNGRRHLNPVDRLPGLAAPTRLPLEYS